MFYQHVITPPAKVLIVKADGGVSTILLCNTYDSDTVHNCGYFSAATYDVQNVTVEVANKIKMRVEFIINSDAIGCFVVLQPHDGSDDIFKALFRNNLHFHVIRLPPSAYMVYVYDLESDGHINEMPAYFLNNIMKKHVGPYNDMGKFNGIIDKQVFLDTHRSSVFMHVQTVASYPGSRAWY